MHQPRQKYYKTRNGTANSGLLGTELDIIGDENSPKISKLFVNFRGGSTSPLFLITIKITFPAK